MTFLIILMLKSQPKPEPIIIPYLIQDILKTKDLESIKKINYNTYKTKTRIRSKPFHDLLTSFESLTYTVSTSCFFLYFNVFS